MTVFLFLENYVIYSERIDFESILIETDFSFNLSKNS